MKENKIVLPSFAYTFRPNMPIHYPPCLNYLSTGAIDNARCSTIPQSTNPTIMVEGTHGSSEQIRVDSPAASSLAAAAGSAHSAQPLGCSPPWPAPWQPSAQHSELDCACPRRGCCSPGAGTPRASGAVAAC
eukprot:322177-Pelagomonas_calceolata.AAC.2